ncbi:DNA internalization-related competence protein ComEC/Rec2 [Brevibacillus sp. SYP-B805]|nr:DNA internalization-related competence protein ComEC/Rec2 [Brevibacillus sp. SYP-B805]
MFFSLSLAVTAGFLAVVYLPPFLWALSAAIVPALFLSGRKAWGRKAALFLLAAGAAAFYFACYDQQHRSSLWGAAAEGRTLVLAGTIDSPVIRDGDTARFALAAEDAGDPGGSLAKLPRAERIAMRVLLTEKSQIEPVESWRIGQRWRGEVTLAVPDPARNPHGFDYARYLRWQGISVTGTASFASVRVEPGTGSLSSVFRGWQIALGKKVEALFPDPDTAGYMKSLLLGLQTDLSPELQQVYANLGALHVLAISGLHVTILGSLALWLAERCGLSRQTALLVTMCVIALYVPLVGASSSAVRAGVMGVLGLLAQFGGRRGDVREMWAASFLLMLAYDPYQLWQAGFQLSFGVTLGLIEFVPLLMSLPSPKLAWLRSLLAVTLSAQLVSFPLLIYWFHQFSPLSLPINLLAVPLLSAVVLPLGLIALLLGMVHPAMAILPARGAAFLLHWIHQAFDRLDQLLLPFRHWPHPDGVWLAAYFFFLWMLPLLWKNGYHRRRDLLAYGLCLALFLCMARQPFTGRDEVRITFLDVGQGDSIVVEVGKERVYLIDGGGTPRFQQEEAWRKKRDPYEVGKDVLLPFLRARGIEHIDILIMTHGDEDHVGGLPAILPYVSVGAALVNGEPPSETEQQVIKALQDRHVPIWTGKPGDSWQDNPHVRWTWLHPGPGSEWSGNNASVVMLLSAYDTNLLFTGDLEESGENALLQERLPPVDVLKVGHHGSRTSTTPALLQRIKPKAAVISVGRHNRYGHPSAVVLQRLADVDANVYRTDRQGGITLIVQPEKMIWQTQILVQRPMQPF